MMLGFNNEVYETLVEDLISDAFYLEGRSNRGIISTIRQYSEVVVRRILNLSNKDYVTLGDEGIRARIQTKSKSNKLLYDSLEYIRSNGNGCTHTQVVESISDENVKKAIDNLFNLYAYLLVEFFERYEFGANSDIVSSFSILPPVIRYIVLEYLYDEYPENIVIIDKLALAILKAFNKERALKWIEERKEVLAKMPSVAKQARQDLIEQLGEEMSEIIISQAPNMYDLCIERITNVGELLEGKGRLYVDFESAIELYHEKGKIKGESLDVVEFNSIMEFLYLGRKKKKNELLEEKDSYFIMDCIF